MSEELRACPACGRMHEISYQVWTRDCECGAKLIQLVEDIGEEQCVYFEVNESAAIPDHIRQLQEYVDAEKIAVVIEATAAKFGLGPDDLIPEPEVRTDTETAVHPPTDR